MSDTKRRRSRHGPEHETWEKLKGESVRVSMVGGTWTISGILVWVDVYTIGVRIGNEKIPTIIYKGPGILVSQFRPE